jgi:thiamine biosynthesis protein ThiI
LEQDYGIILPKGMQTDIGIAVKSKADTLQRELSSEEVYNVFKDGWLNTGDLGMMTIHDEIVIKGRKKDTIVLRGGENIEPLPIEMKLSESRYIKTSVIVGQDQRYLAALILVDEEEIKNYAAENGIHYDTYDNLLASEEIQTLYDTEINTLISSKNGFKMFERVNRFTLIQKPFEVGVELSAKQEIMRYRISEIYSKEIKALGGYPVGVAGKGLLMLSGGIDSPVAGYLAMKRGIQLECIYFESPPHTSVAAKNKVKTLVTKLNKYQPTIKLHVINFTKIQESIYKNIDSTYMITIMRRMMYRIAEKVLYKRNCLVLVNGESVGQVASQTLTSMQVINNVTNIPVIRPVACLDKLEIINIAKKIDTYETSILPYEDCCTVFLPKHPVIKPKIEKCLVEESKLDLESLINNALNSVEIIDIE